ncbi:HlyD family efflux transporter periplasmic adaptor subunit [Luteolibacter sp. SL250]|uniref:efflux RND transporter periplasmic adaptor subunit n=1 Tax=Luteolibacter sp. SL250 TaxID=2995170 RepID=UPI00226E7A3E|nr:HlyD family efflux transporter periplasmic adaptor subunit [Luteolibacter sp. SL250]WAC20555.1 HlyD family efflux transporter periplasmic adaptor subunit [Luteolibacter sp. SL250]
MKSTKSKKGGPIRKLVPWLIVLLLVAAVIYGLKPKPLVVDTAEAKRGPLTVSVVEEGKTRIRHRHVISPPVAGYLRRVELRAGAPIVRGKTVLAVIQASTSNFLDPRTKAEAEARIKASEAIRETRQADLDRATAAMDLADKQLDRQEKLRQSGAAADQDYDIAAAEAQVRKRERNAAEFALRAAASDVEVARAALLQAQAPSADQAKPIEVLAPVDGFVLNVYEESERPVTPGLPIMEVGDVQDLEAEIELLSSDAVGIAPGSDVSIEQWGGGTPLRGKVSVVEPGGFTKVSSLGVEEQRVKVRVDFLDPVPAGHTFGDRYRVEARIVTWKGDDVLQIPTGALYRKGNQWMTFTEENGIARETKVTIGQNNGVSAQILGGLEAGKTVILHPPDKVADGVKVTNGK